jgi:hypothetical protein
MMTPRISALKMGVDRKEVGRAAAGGMADGRIAPKVTLLGGAAE